MKENKEKLKEAIAHVEEAHRVLLDLIHDEYSKEEVKEEPKDNKVKLTIKVVNPYDGVEINDEELEKIRKDLEEIINDFTRE